MKSDSRFNGEEFAFFRALKESEEKLPAIRLPDVRPAVWQRINAERNTISFAGCESGQRLNRWLTRWEIAAAVAVVAGFGATYNCVTGVLSEMYWNGSMYVVSHFF